MKALNARALKVTVSLDQAEVAALPAPDTQRVVLKIDVAGRLFSADVNAKALRKAQAAIATGDHAVVIQGRLVGAAIAEAGLSVMPKAAKTAAA